MNIIHKSRKNKKRPFSYSKKKRGGKPTATTEKPTATTEKPTATTENPLNTTNISEKEEVEKIKQEVEAEKQFQLPDLGLEETGEKIMENTGNIIEGAAINTLEGVGELVGVDLTDPDLAEKNKEKIEEITKNAAEIGTVALEAAAPFTDKLIDETVEASGKALSKMGETGVNVVLNTAEEIPGVGIVIGTLRSLDSISKAVLSSVNAGSEVIETASDTVNASVKNFDHLMEEKLNTENRIKASIDEFTGGSSRKQKHKKFIRTSSKTKKVRFRRKHLRSH